ncbi:MAG: hypothetical protein A2X29_05385 [Elusimicrobia bacterium GWA2_64_40]|nr:MAG: hypothetical protein A2X29_05385 [Elusimicrobia bacterium GWA2_64_40]HAN04108.1 hypothetical protein [Elusimicrobiota bacterium]
MNMETGKTDKAIAAAIAALPYRSPSAGFRAGVMAAIAAQAAAEARLAWALKAAGAMTASWAALVGLAASGPLAAFLADYAPLALEPGGLGQALRLLGARAALVAGRLPEAFGFLADLAGLLPGLPPVYEIGAAMLATAAVIRAIGAPARAEQKI